MNQKINGTRMESQSKNNLPIGFAVFLGMIFTCIVANAISLPLQSGMFTSWKSLPSLPSQAIRIVEADRDNVWVETRDGQIYAATLRCIQNEHCYQWTKLGTQQEITPFQYQPIKRGANCSSLGGNFSPSIPSKSEVKECILAPAYGVLDPEWGYETYFALLADGTIKYWQHGSGLLGLAGSFISSTVIFPVIVAIIISGIYFVKNEVKKRKAG